MFTGVDHEPEVAPAMVVSVEREGVYYTIDDTNTQWNDSWNQRSDWTVYKY